MSNEILKVVKRIYDAKKVIIYGAKEKGKNMLSVCLNIGWEGVIEVVVTSLEKKLEIDSLIGNIEVKEIKDVRIDEDTLVLVCMQECYYSEVVTVLLNFNVNMQNVLYLNSELIMGLKKYAISYRLKSMNIDLNLLRNFSPDDANSLFYSWELKDRWECKSIRKKMWEIASDETAEYVMKNMLTVKYYRSKEEYHRMLAQSCMDGNGLKLEFGVAAGGSIWQFAKNTKGKFYGFDSFEGLPEKFTADMDKGHFKQEILPNLPENVELIKGYFSDTLPDFLVREDVIDKKITFMHIDCDLYSSTKEVFQYLGNKIDKGTIIAFDEYFNYPGWKEGEFRAFQEWVKEKQVEYEYIAYVENNCQVAVKIINKLIN